MNVKECNEDAIECYDNEIEDDSMEKPKRTIKALSVEIFNNGLGWNWNGWTTRLKCIVTYTGDSCFRRKKDNRLFKD